MKNKKRFAQSTPRNAKNAKKRKNKVSLSSVLLCVLCGPLRSLRETSFWVAA
jgi:hypothetical protein